MESDYTPSKGHDMSDQDAAVVEALETAYGGDVMDLEDALSALDKEAGNA